MIVSGLSFIDSDALMSSGFSGLRRLTTSHQSKLSICFASERYTIPHDSVCMQLYALLGTTFHTGNTLVPPSTAPQFVYPHTTPHGAYVDGANSTTPAPSTQNINSGVAAPLIAILAGVCGFLAIVFSFCIYRYQCGHNTDALVYVGVTQTDPGIFFIHGQLVYYPYH